MTPLVTLSEVKTRLRILPAETFHDTDLTMKAAQASSIVTNYLKRPDDYDWGLATDMEIDVVKAAVLEVAANLFERTEPLNEWVKDILHRYRDPSLA